MARRAGRGREGAWGAIILLACAPALAQERAPRATLDESGLTVRGPDDAVRFELGGRLHADFGAGGSRALTNEFPVAADLRRLWIEPKLTFGRNLILNLQYDPASAATPINNLLLSYKGAPVAAGMPSWTLTVGNFKEPFSLEQLISNNDTTFMERSLADTFAPGRDTGLALGTHGRNWTLAAGVYGGNVNADVGRGGVAGTLRATAAPILAQDRVLHLGIAGSYRGLDRGGPALSFGTTPESVLFRESLVDTDVIAQARAVGRLGLEAAWAQGPLRVQAEVIATRVERTAGRDVAFRGGYVYAAWVVNGKAPRYVVEADTATEIGLFKRVAPEGGQRVSRGGPGVVELAVRVAAVDLTDRDIRGGRQRDVTVGVNWYPEPFLRVMANYVHAWADPAATGRPAEAEIGQVRLQIAF
ncbi:OprO/OprP family phosphate-selective porin [Methylobacterium sp. WSM2598]|uniref:OprO/OprP family phosphate-selective porin n=1 Tax=Methylobacterium sp. WSM2598 TaxID=398261 RepID=UPI00036B9B43|nr:porin [Methylobacterium sp. WSM2598]